MNIIKINGDGSCLFRAISLLLTDTQFNHGLIREIIVLYIIKNWADFSILTHDNNGDNYNSKIHYYFEMIKSTTFGSLCEIIAASKLFEIDFEVYRNNKLYFKCNNGFTIKKLNFSNNLSNGHFDVIL